MKKFKGVVFVLIVILSFIPTKPAEVETIAFSDNANSTSPVSSKPTEVETIPFSDNSNSASPVPSEPVEVERYLVLNPSYFRDSKPLYVTVSEGAEGKIEPLLKSYDTPEILLDISNLDVTYSSSNTEIVEINEKTGDFKVKKPGEATITVVGSENEIKLTFKVKEKGAMAEAEVRGQAAIEQINTLIKTDITSANVAKLWNDVIKLSYSIDYYPDMDWEGDEPYLYSLTGDENYWAIPNFYKLQEFLEQMIPVLEKEANELLEKQEIVNVSNMNDDSLKIEFKYPLTRNFYTYYEAISVEGDVYGAMLSCYLYDENDEECNYGILKKVEYDANTIEVRLSSKLEKGTYTLECSEYLCSKPFIFTYK